MTIYLAYIECHCPILSKDLISMEMKCMKVVIWMVEKLQMGKIELVFDLNSGVFLVLPCWEDLIAKSNNLASRREIAQLL